MIRVPGAGRRLLLLSLGTIVAGCVGWVGTALVGTAGIGTALFGAPPAGASAPAWVPKLPVDRSPFGEMNLAWTQPGMVGVVGWAKDPDVNRPIGVVVAVEGGGLVRRTAGVYNPYLGGPVASRYRSYLVGIDVPAGSRVMCVAAINVGRGRPFQLLGCSRLDVETPDPVGELERVELTDAGDRLRVAGWALDPENPFPLPTTVTVDGVDTARLVAVGERPDLAASAPGKGTLHGFDGEVPVAPGVREVCVRAQNIGRGADRVIGCRRVVVPPSVPTGALEDVAVGTDELVVTGWAADPDAGDPISVYVTDARRGTADDAESTLVPADGDRPDIAADTGSDRRVGVRATLTLDEPGTHDVCLIARNVGRGYDRVLGCRSVDVADHRPTAVTEAVVPTASGVTVSGWAFDVDDPDPVTVRVTVGGSTTTTTANRSRPDVDASHPGAGGARGFSVDVGGLAAGRHTVCVRFVDEPSAPGTAAVTGDRTPACGAVVVGSGGSLALGTTGAALDPPAPVGPRAGPLADVDRDAGVSVTLRDGSVLWLFGDSSASDASGALRYFVSGTGAWASADDPTATRDAVDGAGRPVLLAQPTGEFPACPASRQQPAMWPLSAVAVPSGPTTDRVIVHLANMCLGSADEFAYRGIALGEWTYDSAAPPAGQPIRLTVLRQVVPTSRPFGSAATLDAGGRLVLFACDRPADLFDADAFGPCRAARVDPDDVGDTGRYRFWNGSTWVAGESNAVAMTMPAGAADGLDFPASSFTVTFDPVHGVYVMVYSPWPGFSDRAVVRVARQPQGPWTPPVEVRFAACDEQVRGAAKLCYGATAQPLASAPGRLGVGYYDQAVPTSGGPGAPGRGQYLVAQVPFTVPNP